MRYARDVHQMKRGSGGILNQPPAIMIHDANQQRIPMNCMLNRLIVFYKDLEGAMPEGPDQEPS